MGLFNDPGGWINSAANDVSAAIGTDRSDSFIGHVGEVLAHDKTAQLAAVAAAIYFGLPYIPGGPELAAYVSEMAGAGETVGAGGVTAADALSSAGAGAGAGIGVAAPAGYAGAADAALATGAAAAGAAASTPWYLSPTALQTGAGLVGGLIQNASQRQAASMQSDAAQRAIDLQSSINKQQTELNAPFYNAGITGQNRLMDLLGLGANKGAADYGKYAKDFSMADYQADPGYAFRLSEGMKQLGHTAASRGGLISGQTMKGLQDYAQGSASQEYSNAFNRYQTNRSNQLQPLGNLQNVGISAANQQSAALGNYGANVSNLLGQQGQAQAAGALGQGNTINTAIGSGISAYQNNALIDQLRRLNPSTYGSAA
jgi:hypothetical protein